MLPDPEDTIVALSSALGPGARAIVRLSGPESLRIAGQVFDPIDVLTPSRRFHGGHVQIAGIAARLPADVYVWPAPATYTGQEMVEFHLPSSPPLVEAFIARVLSAGARAAQAGEFTLRAFLAGK